MTSLIRRRPIGIQPFARTPFGTFFDWASVPEYGESHGTTIGVDAYYDDDNLVVKASVPGFDPEQIDVTTDDGVLKIEATRESEGSDEGKGYLIRERARGVLHRSIRLPKGVDFAQAEAAVRNGVLTVTVPRSAESRSRRLEVKTS